MVFDIPYLVPLDWDYGAVTNIITYRNLISSDFPRVNIQHPFYINRATLELSNCATSMFNT